MSTSFLAEVQAFVAARPSATAQEVLEAFGRPVFSTGACGSYKTYNDFVFLRRGEFVQVQHRDFGRTQLMRVRPVEPVEIVEVRTAYVGADGEADSWVSETGIVPNRDALNDEFVRKIEAWDI